jgi:hypothetical protein
MPGASASASARLIDISLPKAFRRDIILELKEDECACCVPFLSKVAWGV